MESIGILGVCSCVNSKENSNELGGATCIFQTTKIDVYRRSSLILYQYNAINSVLGIDKSLRELDDHYSIYRFLGKELRIIEGNVACRIYLILQYEHEFVLHRIVVNFS